MSAVNTTPKGILMIVLGFMIATSVGGAMGKVANAFTGLVKWLCIWEGGREGGEREGVVCQS